VNITDDMLSGIEATIRFFFPSSGMRLTNHDVAQLVLVRIYEDPALPGHFAEDIRAVVVGDDFLNAIASRTNMTFRLVTYPIIVHNVVNAPPPPSPPPRPLLPFDTLSAPISNALSVLGATADDSRFKVTIAFVVFCLVCTPLSCFLNKRRRLIAASIRSQMIKRSSRDSGKNVPGSIPTPDSSSSGTAHGPPAPDTTAMDSIDVPFQEEEDEYLIAAGAPLHVTCRSAALQRARQARAANAATRLGVGTQGANQAAESGMSAAAVDSEAEQEGSRCDPSPPSRRFDEASFKGRAASFLGVPETSIGLSVMDSGTPSDVSVSMMLNTVAGGDGSTGATVRVMLSTVSSITHNVLVRVLAPDEEAAVGVSAAASQAVTLTKNVSALERARRSSRRLSASTTVVQDCSTRSEADELGMESVEAMSIAPTEDEQQLVVFSAMVTTSSETELDGFLGPSSPSPSPQACAPADSKRLPVARPQACNSAALQRARRARESSRRDKLTAELEQCVCRRSSVEGSSLRGSSSAYYRRSSVDWAQFHASKSSSPGAGAIRRSQSAYFIGQSPRERCTLSTTSREETAGAPARADSPAPHTQPLDPLTEALHVAKTLGVAPPPPPNRQSYTSDTLQSPEMATSRVLRARADLDSRTDSFARATGRRPPVRTLSFSGQGSPVQRSKSVSHVTASPQSAFVRPSDPMVARDEQFRWMTRTSSFEPSRRASKGSFTEPSGSPAEAHLGVQPPVAEVPPDWRALGGKRASSARAGVIADQLRWLDEEMGV